MRGWPSGEGVPAESQCCGGPGAAGAFTRCAFVRSRWAGCLAEVGRGVAKVTQPFQNWASVSSVNVGPRASKPDGCGQAEQRTVFQAEAPAVVGEAGASGQEFCRSGPPAPNKARAEAPATAAHWTGCPWRRVLMGPEGVSADGPSRLRQQGQLPTPRGVLDPAVSCTQSQVYPARPRR